MAKDIDVAAYVYGRLGWVDSWRLQKLTYYSQAWALAWTGRPLFADPIQAWDDGPVAPELFKINKHHRKSVTELPGADPWRLSSSGMGVVDAILDFYGSLDAKALIDLTHAEDPWRTTFRKGQNREIRKPSMAGFYARLSVRGADVPDRPELPEPVITETSFMAQVEMQEKIWAGTLELLAK